MRVSIITTWLLTILILVSGWIGHDLAAAENQGNVQPPKSVELAGKLVCLPEEMHRVYGTDLPTNHRHVQGFRTDQGEYYTLLETKLSVALFKDSLFKSKQLLLKGSVYPGSRILDVTLIRAVTAGRVYDVYYWCDICSIKSVVPGECMCCQQDVEYQEIPSDTPGLENIP